MRASEKRRKCLGCEQIVENPGDIVCPRCRIQYSPPPKRYKLLVIDDDMQFLKDMKKKLEGTLYFEVATAFDGAKGYEKIEYEKPELIIVDVVMPRLNGPDFVHKLRRAENPGYRQMPVLVVAEKEAMQKFFDPGDIQGFFLKPLQFRELFLAVKELLKIQKAA
jgi:DNA-binding response OmpR family regulator